MLQHTLQSTLQLARESERTANYKINPIVRGVRACLPTANRFPGIRVPHVTEIYADETRSNGFELAGFHGEREHFAGVASSEHGQLGGVGVVEAQDGVHEECSGQGEYEATPVPKVGCRCFGWAPVRRVGCCVG